MFAFTAPTPAITLVPRARHLSTTATITAVPGTQLGANRKPVASDLDPQPGRNRPATGKGHQDAEAARGTITFYNGLFSSQTVEAGTLLTGSDGVAVVTDQVAVIPAARASTPPTYGQVTVPARAALVGPQGNIRVRDIKKRVA